VIEEGHLHVSAADTESIIPGISGMEIISIVLSFSSEGDMSITSPTIQFCATPITTTRPPTTSGKIVVLPHFVLQNTFLGCFKVMLFFSNTYTPIFWPTC
jgi:hypothetical protein